MTSLRKRTKPKISVIMGVYNGGAYLSRAIDSILDQTFDEFEFIIINDGSTDNSDHILETYTYQDARVRLVHQKNMGLIKTLNRGIEMAKAPLIARMDADDVALPGRLEKQFRFMQDNPHIAVLGGAVQLVDGKGQKGQIVRYPSYGEDMDQAIQQASPVAHPAVMMRAKVVKQVNGYRNAFKHAEDYDLWLRIYEQHGIDNLPDTILRYRHHAGNISFRHAEAQAVSTASSLLAYRIRQRTGTDPVNESTVLSQDTPAQWRATPEETREFEVLRSRTLARLFIETGECRALKEVLSPIGRQPVPQIQKPLTARILARAGLVFIRNGKIISGLQSILLALRLDGNELIKRALRKT